MGLLTAKPVLFVANIDEKSIPYGNRHSQEVEALAQERNADMVMISGKIEAELVDLPETERAEFLRELGLTETGLAPGDPGGLPAAFPDDLLYGGGNRASGLVDPRRDAGAQGRGKDPYRHGARLHPGRGDEV